MDNESSIGTVVDRITCSYIKYAVVTNIRRTMNTALEAGFPEEWSCHLDLRRSRVIWTRDGLPCEVYATPAEGPSLFDTDISVAIELYTATNMHAPVQEVDKLQAWVASQNLDDGLSIPMDWSGDPDSDALAYLMAVAPILKTIGDE